MSSADEQTAQVSKLIERLVVDPVFRAQFRADPAEVCRANGLDDLAEEFGSQGRAMYTLEMRESKSSLAGVVMAVAAEGVGVVELKGMLGHGGLHGPAKAAALKALKAGGVKTPHGGAAGLAKAAGLHTPPGGASGKALKSALAHASHAASSGASGSGGPSSGAASAPARRLRAGSASPGAAAAGGAVALRRALRRPVVALRPGLRRRPVVALRPGPLRRAAVVLPARLPARAAVAAPVAPHTRRRRPPGREPRRLPRCRGAAAPPRRARLSRPAGQRLRPDPARAWWKLPVPRAARERRRPRRAPERQRARPRLELRVRAQARVRCWREPGPQHRAAAQARPRSRSCYPAPGWRCPRPPRPCSQAGASIRGSCRCSRTRSATTRSCLATCSRSSIRCTPRRSTSSRSTASRSVPPTSAPAT